MFRQDKEGIIREKSNSHAAGRVHSEIDRRFGKTSVLLVVFPKLTQQHLEYEVERLLNIHSEAEGMHVNIVPGTEASEEAQSIPEIDSTFIATWHDVISSFLIPKKNS